VILTLGGVSARVAAGGTPGAIAPVVIVTAIAFVALAAVTDAVATAGGANTLRAILYRARK